MQRISITDAYNDETYSCKFNFDNEKLVIDGIKLDTNVSNKFVFLYKEDRALQKKINVYINLQETKEIICRDMIELEQDFFKMLLDVEEHLKNYVRFGMLKTIVFPELNKLTLKELNRQKKARLLREKDNKREDSLKLYMKDEILPKLVNSALQQEIS